MVAVAEVDLEVQVEGETVLRHSGANRPAEKIRPKEANHRAERTHRNEASLLDARIPHPSGTIRPSVVSPLSEVIPRNEANHLVENSRRSAMIRRAETFRPSATTHREAATCPRVITASPKSTIRARTKGFATTF